MKILLSPYSRPMRNDKINPKNYPFWPELIAKLHELGHQVIQIGRVGEIRLVADFKFGLPLKQVKDLINECDLWISVDNFLPHMANHTTKRGIVLFGMSDPNIYGYPQNINMLKDRKFLREKQFDIWEVIEANDACFVSPNVVIREILNFKETK